MSAGNALSSARIPSRAQASIFFFTYRSEAAFCPTSTMASVGTSPWRSMNAGTSARSRASSASATVLPNITTAPFWVVLIAAPLLAFRRPRPSLELAITAAPPMAKPRFDARRLLVIVAGERPVALLCFVSPTLLAIAMDLVLRPRSLLAFEPLEWLNYFGSSLASAGFWGGAPWLAARLFPPRSRVGGGRGGGAGGGPGRPGRAGGVLRSLRLSALVVLLRRPAALLPRVPHVHGARHGAPRHRDARHARGVARRVGRVRRAHGGCRSRHDVGVLPARSRRGEAGAARVSDPARGRVRGRRVVLLDGLRRVAIA